MRKLLAYWQWWLPLLCYSADAHAWGLYTHVYFAQLLLWSTPLADKRFRRAVIACPRLVLAGACLPDLSLVGRHCGAPQLDATHHWESVQRQLRNAASDEERALALGYASHLLVDVIAHNHFVPAHEKMWLDVPMATHAAVEWAMDTHIRQQLFVTPTELLNQHRHELSAHVARHFGCTAASAWHSLRLIARADAMLRSSRLPDICYHSARLLDGKLHHRFNYYLRATGSRMGQINRVLAGEVPLWHAEPASMDATRARIGLCTPRQLQRRMPLPQGWFQTETKESENSASTAPMAAPASTSLG